MRSAVGALIAVVLMACSPSTGVVATTAPATPAPAASTAPTQTAAAPTAAPTRGPVTEITQVFRPVTIGWRPTTTTAIVASANDDATLTLVAVPLAPSSVPTPLVSFPQAFWSIRGDGSAIAVAIRTDVGARIAVYEPSSGASRWLTDPGQAYRAFWSKDGGSVLYAMTHQDLSGTVYRIDANGENRKAIASLERFGELSGVTPDGRGVMWSRAQAGGSAEILDIASGSSRHLDDVAQIVSWRSQQPRALLSVGGCCAGRPGGSLVVWDDSALTSRVIAARSPVGVAWGAAAWEPNGDRIAAVRFDSTSPYAGSLVILDTAGVVQRAIAGSSGTGQVDWVDDGIVFTAGRTGDFASDLMVLRPSGTLPVSLFNDARIQQFSVVKP